MATASSSGALALASLPASSPALRVALAAAGLPADDLAEDGRMFFEADFGGGVIGYGGLELYGPEALLRSVVVDPRRRGLGYGRALTEALLREAAARGAERVYLLTDTARPYFERQGFEVISRGDAPEAILNTRQASSLCPSSAALMVRTSPSHTD